MPMTFKNTRTRGHSQSCPRHGATGRSGERKG